MATNNIFATPYITQADMVAYGRKLTTKEISDFADRAILNASKRVNALTGGKIMRLWQNDISKTDKVTQDGIKLATFDYACWFLAQGLDATIGSKSFNLGSMSASQTQPDKPDYIPPTVIETLQQIGLYNNYVTQEDACCENGKGGFYDPNNEFYYVNSDQINRNFVRKDKLTSSDGSIKFTYDNLPDSKVDFKIDPSKIPGPTFGDGQAVKEQQQAVSSDQFNDINSIKQKASQADLNALEQTTSEGFSNVNTELSTLNGQVSQNTSKINDLVTHVGDVSNLNTGIAEVVGSINKINTEVVGIQNTQNAQVALGTPIVDGVALPVVLSNDDKTAIVEIQNNANVKPADLSLQLGYYKAPNNNDITYFDYLVNSNVPNVNFTNPLNKITGLITVSNAYVPSPQNANNFNIILTAQSTTPNHFAGMDVLTLVRYVNATGGTATNGTGNVVFVDTDNTNPKSTLLKHKDNTTANGINVYGDTGVFIQAKAGNAVVIANENNNNTSMSVASTGVGFGSSTPINFNNNTITGVKAPTTDDAPSNKLYVDNAIKNAPTPQWTLTGSPTPIYDNSNNIIRLTNIDTTYQLYNLDFVIESDDNIDNIEIQIKFNNILQIKNAKNNLFVLTTNSKPYILEYVVNITSQVMYINIKDATGNDLTNKFSKLNNIKANLYGYGKTT